MFEIKINPQWTFKEIINNIKAMKVSYEEHLRLFSCLNKRKELEYIRTTKENFYILDLPEWQIDRLWEYINGNLPFHVLKDISNRQNIK